MIIDQVVYDEVILHMQQSYPREGVGLLAGPRDRRCSRDTSGDGDCGRPRCPECGPDGAVVDRWVPLDNVSDFPRVRYEVDDRQLIDAWEALEADGGRRPWVVAHSHVGTGPAPSETDIRYAVDESLLHLVVSLGATAVFPRLWRIRPHAPNAAFRALAVPFQVTDLHRQEYPATDLTRRVSGA